MNSYIYSQIKDSVTMTEILERYGIEVNKGFSLCPFHNEKTPSLKVYEHDFYCFGCGEGGDIIKFVSMYLNVSMSEAARNINDDFNLGLPVDKKLKRRERLEMARKSFNANREQKNKQQERDKFLNNYHSALDEFIRLYKNKIKYKPKSLNEELHPLFIEALMELPHQEHRLECAEMELYEYESRNS